MLATNTKGNSAAVKGTTHSTPELSGEDKNNWNVGDRVIVHSLKKASHLNGRHGCVGGDPDSTTGRFPIDFDLPNDCDINASSSDHSASLHRVMAKPDNLKREPDAIHLAHRLLFHRAAVQDGALA